MKNLKIIKFLINFLIRISGKAKVIQGNVDVEDKNVQVYFTKHKCLVNQYIEKVKHG